MGTVDRYLSTRPHLSPQTKRRLRYTLTALIDFGSPPTRSSVTRWLGTLEGLSAGTIRNHLSAVKHFLGWCVDNDHTTTDLRPLLPKVRRPRRVPRAIDDPHALDALVASLPDSRARLVVGLMRWLGLRRGEVSQLRVDDIDRRSRQVRVIGKGGHERVLPLPDRVLQLVDAYLADWPAHPGDWLVRSHVDGYSPLQAETIGEYVSQWMREAGLKRRPWDGVSGHALRHTLASDVLDRCGDLRVVQELLGHSELATTSIYLRLAGSARLRDALEAS